MNMQCISSFWPIFCYWQPWCNKEIVLFIKQLPSNKTAWT